MIWIQTYSGLALDLFDPKPEHFSLLDIAHALSRICRYTGHSRDHTSVAEHTCRVSDVVFRRMLAPHSMAVATEAAWAALTHDAPEEASGDVSRPMKLAMRHVARESGREESDFDVIEDRLGRGAAKKLDPFGRAHVWAALVKEVDLADLVTEKVAQLGPSPRPWTHRTQPHGLPIECWDAARARREWLFRAARLAPTEELRDEAKAAMEACGVSR